MDTASIGDLFRVVNILLAIVYLPLLASRVRYVQRDQVQHALGDGLFVLAVVVGSASLLHVHFVPSQPMVTLALIIWIVASMRNDRRRRLRNRRERP